jgi:hypothetical protein
MYGKLKHTQTNRGICAHTERGINRHINTQTQRRFYTRAIASCEPFGMLCRLCNQTGRESWIKETSYTHTNLHAERPAQRARTWSRGRNEKTALSWVLMSPKPYVGILQCNHYNHFILPKQRSKQTLLSTFLLPHVHVQKSRQTLLCTSELQHTYVTKSWPEPYIYTVYYYIWWSSYQI